MLLACVYFLLLHVYFACYGNTFVNSLRVCTLLLSFPLAGDENILNTCGIGQCLLGLKLIMFFNRYSLSTSNSSIAALLCALYPHFPVHSTDNR